MSYSLVPLESLGSLFQGLNVSRYETERGTSEFVVHQRNLDFLYVENALSRLFLDAPVKERYRLEENDVVLTTRGVYQKASVVGANVAGTLVGNNLAVLRPTELELNPLYLAVLFRSQWLQQTLITLYGQSSATRILTLSQLRQLAVPLPDLTIQVKIAELFLATEQVRIKTLASLEKRQQVAELTLSRFLEEGK